jgi:hypothetical protein
MSQPHDQEPEVENPPEFAAEHTSDVAGADEGLPVVATSEQEEGEVIVGGTKTVERHLITEDEGGGFREWLATLQYWGYGFGLVAIVLLILGVQTIIIIINRPAAFESGSYLPGGGDPGPPPPPAAASEVPQETVPEQALQVSTSTTEVIASENVNAEQTFTLPVPTISTPNLDSIQKTTEQVQQNMKQAMEASLSARKGAIGDMVSAWGSGGGGSGGAGPAGSGRNVRAKFKAVVTSGTFTGGKAAKLADLSTSYDKDHKPVRHPLINMVAMLGYYCRQVDAQIDPNCIPLDSPELFKIKPPFIYMVGYKDFKLTDAEIENLRKYLMQGGAVWADSGLAGVGSTFDLAFRREMKRVIPDSDKNFKPIPLNHPVYREPFVFKGAPPGMNFRADPVEALAIDGLIAIIYTPNNYTDLMRLTFPNHGKGPPGKEMDRTEGPDKIFKTDEEFAANKRYFRNFEPQAAEQAYQLSTNIVIHLLKRFDTLLNSP